FVLFRNIVARPATQNLPVGQVPSHRNAPVAQTGEVPENAPKGAVSGAEVPVLVSFSFPRIVTVSPFLHS
ncbi:MAG: hypothetical protein RL215_57, partial [Planctomycetota bacterium]